MPQRVEGLGFQAVLQSCSHTTLQLLAQSNAEASRPKLIRNYLHPALPELAVGPGPWHSASAAVERVLLSFQLIRMVEGLALEGGEGRVGLRDCADCLHVMLQGD